MRGFTVVAFLVLAGCADNRNGSDAGPGIDAGALCAFTSELVNGCSLDEDCVVGVHQTDCCGSTVAIGINHAERDRFDAAEATCRSSYPGCACPSGPTTTDSGESTNDPASIQVGCIARGPTDVCLTYVTMRPPDAP